jgi:CRISPR/Cas system-associated exonuclease Cas4 (RecB family)
MAWGNKPKPQPGRPVRRAKNYIWVTWLAKLLGGDQCMWSGWFKAHYQYVKFEKDAESLQEWNREHTQLMTERRLELQNEGWTVYGEEQNAFTVIGEKADVAGKPDIVAVKGVDVLLVDGKTGKQRDSDIWQVLLYLWGIPLSASDIRDVLAGKTVEGEVQYKRGDQRITVTPPQPDQVEHIVRLVKVISADQAPPKAPSRWECQRCNVGAQDCPERFVERARRIGSTKTAAGF